MNIRIEDENGWSYSTPRWTFESLPRVGDVIVGGGWDNATGSAHRWLVEAVEWEVERISVVIRVRRVTGELPK